jgi:hypothetical protein
MLDEISDCSNASITIGAVFSSNRFISWSTDALPLVMQVIIKTSSTASCEILVSKFREELALPEYRTAKT